MKKELPKIVIVGGGAGGVELAVKLGDSLGKKHLAEIFLIDKNLTHVWKPLLHEVAAGTLNSHEDEVDYLVLARQHHFKFEFGSLVGLKRAAKVLTLQANELDNNLLRNLHYDILILAIGSITNDFHIEGAREHCYFLDERQQAERLHQEFVNHYIKLQYHESDKLRVAIVGGGATGVELAAELHYAAKSFSQFDIGDSQKRQDVDITVIESGSRLLASLPPHLSKQIHAELNRHGIKILLNEKVLKVTKEGIHTAGGSYIQARIKVWTAGVKCSDFMKQLDGLELNKLNQLLVKPTLQTTADNFIFALGDCAACPQPDSDKSVPPRAQSAHQEADLLAKSLNGWVKGKPLLTFKYKDFGSLVTISRHKAIGQLMAHKEINIGLGGRIARWMYLALYKRHQVVMLGWWKTFLLTIANIFIRPTKTRLKLH